MATTSPGRARTRHIRHTTPQRAADSGQAGIQRLPLTLLAMAEAALDEMDGRRMEAAEGRRVHQLRDQQYAEMIGQLPEQ